MHKNTHKYRRMVKRLPDEMKELLSHVNHECVILAHHAGSMGWSVDFQIKSVLLCMVYDRGSIIVLKDPCGERKNLRPEGKLWTTVTMEELAHEVNVEFA